ncbi:McrC family protein [Streptomyces litchfieldiae]|uniref:Restriction endonuclease n=1 Tax=Streptomyces litchfieldiae TaxID=3075543 RepID=A0ABU2MQZ5_9ACTN|nr:restriction endonuclease [Streptomyces sp. DSM 44938]MDT0343514.1 restriction endonuclease [Streptomyces sp. DSM 44938]
MIDIELQEHGAAVTRPLPAAAARALAGSGVIDTAPDPHRPDHWRLRAGGKAGAVSLRAADGERLTLRIAPKVPIARLFFLLGYAVNPQVHREGFVGLAEQPDVLPAMAQVYERALAGALRQGVLQGYRYTEEASPVLRGRLREADQIRRHHGRTFPVEVAYDAYTTDIPENRLLRAATERLLRLPRVPGGVRRRLGHHRVLLGDAGPLSPGPGAGPGWRPSRLNLRYQPALRLAEAVLRGSSVDHLPGGVAVDGFLLDTHKIFEDFVCVALREALLPHGGRSVLQAGGVHLDEDATIRMRPDLVWYEDGGRPRAVVDAKYKAEKPEGFPDADLYQMLAYCTALGLGEGHLVYAKGSGPPVSHRVRRAGIVLHQHALDLDGSPGELLASIRVLAERLAGPPR